MWDAAVTLYWHWRYVPRRAISEKSVQKVPWTAIFMTLHFCDADRTCLCPTLSICICRWLHSTPHALTVLTTQTPRRAHSTAGQALRPAAPAVPLLPQQTSGPSSLRWWQHSTLKQPQPPQHPARRHSLPLLAPALLTAQQSWLQPSQLLTLLRLLLLLPRLSQQHQMWRTAVQALRSMQPLSLLHPFQPPAAARSLRLSWQQRRQLPQRQWQQQPQQRRHA